VLDDHNAVPHERGQERIARVGQVHHADFAVQRQGQVSGQSEVIDTGGIDGDIDVGAGPVGAARDGAEQQRETYVPAIGKGAAQALHDTLIHAQSLLDDEVVRHADRSHSNGGTSFFKEMG